MPLWKKDSEPTVIVPDKRRERIVKYKVFGCEMDQLEKELNEREDIKDVLGIIQYGSAVKVVTRVL